MRPKLFTVPGGSTQYIPVCHRSGDIAINAQYVNVAYTVAYTTEPAKVASDVSYWRPITGMTAATTSAAAAVAVATCLRVTTSATTGSVKVAVAQSDT